MKSYPSPTTNGGTTIVLDSVQDATASGQAYINGVIERLMKYPDAKIKIRYHQRDGKVKTKEKTCRTYVKEEEEGKKQFEEACSALLSCDESLRALINQTLEELRDSALDIEPMLAVGYSGYERSEDGFTAAPELVASGEERPCFQRRRASNEVARRDGDGAYRIIINTDVAWWGNPEDNAAVMGALVTILQQHGPVEVWIQQGWLGKPGKMEEGDGVTLFKLDFTGSFEATQLTFWLNHKFKDVPYSSFVNRGLGRRNAMTSQFAEIPCDLYLRGDWMTLAGLTEADLKSMMHIERCDAMSRWIASTAMQILQPKPEIVINE